MGPRDFSLVLAAAETRRLNVSANYVHVMAAPGGSLFIALDDGSELERVSGEGIFVGEGFRKLNIRTVAAQTARIMVAEEPQVTGGGATGAPGGVATTISEQPSSTISALADNAIAAATTEAIAANASRRRITIGVLSTAAAAIRVTSSGGPALSGIEIGPGQFVEFRTTAALDVHNDDAALATSYYIFEESGP